MTRAKLITDIDYDGEGFIIPKGTTGQVYDDIDYSDGFDYVFDFDTPIDGINGLLVHDYEVEIEDE